MSQNPIKDKQESRKFQYLTDLYEAMDSEAEFGIYEGRIVDTFQSLRISQAHYTPLFNILKELGCIELLDRGVRGRLTRYQLHGAPTREAYDKLYDGGLTYRRKPATISFDELEQRISNLEGRLKTLDIQLVNDALVNHEERLTTLEGGSNAKT